MSKDRSQAIPSPLAEIDQEELSRVFDLYDGGLISGATACELLGLDPATARDESGFREKLRRSMEARKEASEW